MSNLKQFQNEKSKEQEGIPVSLPVGSPEGNKAKTLEVIAQKAGVSRATAEQYDAIQRKGTEEQKAEVAEGKVSIKKVYTQIQKAKRLEKN